MKNGISIDHLKIASFTIDRLYLKLDKKLILRADKLTIPRSRKRQALPNLEEGLDRFNEILRYFETIELKEVNFKNDRYSILYSDHIFYMVNDLFEIATHQITRVGERVQAVIDLVYIKEYDIRLSGKLVYNYKRDTALVKGSAEYRDIHADFLLNKKRSNLYFAIRSKRFRALKPLIDQLHLPPAISPWIGERVRAESYRLQSLKGAAKLDRDGIRLLPATLTGSASLEGVTIDFKDGLNCVEAESMKVSLRQGRLYFDAEKPHYAATSLKGSRVSITHLFDRAPVTLKLDLLFDSRLDRELLKILEAYHIDIPLLQKRGKTLSRVRLDIDLKSKKVDCICDFEPGDGEMEIGDFAFLTEQSGTVHIENDIVKLDRIAIGGKGYRAWVGGEIDLKRQRAKLKLDLDYFHLEKDGKIFFSMGKRILPVEIEYGKDTVISIPSLKLEVRIARKDRSGTIVLGDIALLRQSLRGLPITINGGKLTLRTEDFKAFTFKGVLNRRDCFLYEKSSSCLSRVPIEGHFSEKGLILRAFQGRFVYDARKSLITLNGLNLDLKKYFKNLKGSSGGEMRKKLRIEARGSTLRYGKSKLVTDRYTLGLLPGGDFHFRGELGRDLVIVTRRREKLEIKADRISDRMLHPLINFGGLQKGRYTLRMSGVPGKMMRGVIRLENGIMSSFKAYNNVIALINTVPALATLSSPGFSARGFVIKHGEIKFTVAESRILTFDSVLIKGKSATISGDGVVDLESGKINIDLAIQTARGVGSLVGKLPVVGYILTGKNRSFFTVGLHIGGTLEKPEAKTSAIKDVLMLPFKMIERTFEGPEKQKDYRDNF